MSEAKYAHVNLEELAKDYADGMTYEQMCIKHGISNKVSLTRLLGKAGVALNRGPGGRAGTRRLLSVVPDEPEITDPRIKLLDVAIPAFIQGSPTIAKAVAEAMNEILVTLRMETTDEDEVEALLVKMFGPA